VSDFYLLFLYLIKPITVIRVENEGINRWEFRTSERWKF